MSPTSSLTREARALAPDPPAGERPASTTMTLRPHREIDFDSTAGPAGPSTAGLVTVLLLLGLTAVGAAGTVRRRLDPRCRAETTVFDRAGVALADRRRLRRAARRLDPPVPAASLLLSPPLLAAARRAPGCSPADAAALAALARRRFGPDAAEETPGPAISTLASVPPRPSRSFPRPAVRPAAAVAGEAGPHRGRTVSLLAVAMAAAEERRTTSTPPVTPATVGPRTAEPSGTVTSAP